MSWKISSKDKYVIMASAGLLQFLTGQSVFDIIALVREYDYIFSLFVSLSFVLIINGFRSFIAFINKTYFFFIKEDLPLLNFMWRLPAISLLFETNRIWYRHDVLPLLQTIYIYIFMYFASTFSHINIFYHIYIYYIFVILFYPLI